MSVSADPVSVELSGRSVDLLELLRLYWLCNNSVTDSDIIEKALLCYFRYLVSDDEMISFDVMVDAWRKYHAVI